MADRVRRQRRQDAPPPVARSIEVGWEPTSLRPSGASPRSGSIESDEAERRLGRAVALGLPVATVIGAIVVGFVASVSSGILVVAAGTLLGTIALLWASVRTLTGDAPLSGQLESLTASGQGVDDLAERKRRVLRALKDLEADHAIGKIDDEDYAAVTAQYRDEAKVLMREMDLELEPLREEAERIAREYLEKHGQANHPAEDGAAPVAAVPPSTPARDDDRRVDCPSCKKSNEADAAFCKQCGAAMKNARPEKADAAT